MSGHTGSGHTASRHTASRNPASRQQCADDESRALDLIAAIAARLREARVPDCGKTPVYLEVLDALDAAALKTWPKMPAAFVFPLSETFAASRTLVAAVQKVETVVAVQTLIAAPNDPSGTRARSRLAGTINASRRQLAGWCPGEGVSGVLTLRRGFMLGIEGGRIEWRDEYMLPWWFASGERLAGEGRKG